MRGLVRGVVLTTAFVGFGGAFVNSTINRVKTSSHLQVSQVEASGNQTLSSKEVLEWAGIKLGSSLVDISASDVSSRLLEHPGVREATIKRSVPGHVLIVVKERTPLALVLGSGKMLAVDETGKVFKGGRDLLRRDYPVFRSKHDGKCKVGQKLFPEVWPKIIRVLREAKDKGLEISEIALSGSGLSLVTMDGDTVRMNVGDFNVLGRVVWVLAREKTLGRRSLDLDTRPPDMVIVGAAR